MLELDGLGEVIGHDAAMALAINGGVARVSMEDRVAHIRQVADEERADLETWFADDGTPAADHQTDASQ